MNRRIRAYAPLGIFFALAILFFVGLFMGDPSRLPSALEGRALPRFDLPALFAGDAGLTQAHSKPALLNVWASWCAPCRAEHPFLMQLADAGVAVYGLNYKDDNKSAKRFLARLGNPYRGVGVDADGRTAVELGVYGVPESFVIGADGTVLYRHVGPLTNEIMTREIRPHLLRDAPNE